MPVQVVLYRVPQGLCPDSQVVLESNPAQTPRHNVVATQGVMLLQGTLLPMKPHWPPCPRKQYVSGVCRHSTSA